MGCLGLKGNRSDAETPMLSLPQSAQVGVVQWHALCEGTGLVSSGIKRSTDLSFSPYIAHRMPFWLIHICSVLALVLFPPVAYKKWPFLIPGRWGCPRTFSLRRIIICCFGSKPMGTNSRLANSAHKKKKTTCTYRICCHVMSTGVTGYGVTEGNAYCKHQNTRRSKALLFWNA